MSEIRKWLGSIGLGQYVEAFEVNKIDMDLLGQVDDQILKGIGVSAAGDRLRIRNAIAKLANAPIPEVNLSPSTSKHDDCRICEATPAYSHVLSVRQRFRLGSTPRTCGLSSPRIRRRWLNRFKIKTALSQNIWAMES